MSGDPSVVDRAEPPLVKSLGLLAVLTVVRVADELLGVRVLRAARS